ncbi:hypothetical protein O9992_26565 [Vibrio lentus]|nr:hypothetical protein [Vibrio lentus]
MRGQPCVFQRCYRWEKALGKACSKRLQNGNGNLIYLSGGMATVDYGSFHRNKPLTLTVEDTKVAGALPNIKAAVPTAVWDESRHCCRERGS